VADQRDQIERFIGAVHRRHVLLRILESAGVGVTVAAALGAAVVAVLLWRGEEPWTVLYFSLATGAICGAIWAVARRPPTLAAAAEADGQLRTSDLLATAWSMRDAPQGEPFVQTVLALAAAQCARVRPSEVVLRRLGVRAWGGIVLSLGFVITLAALSSASRSQARDTVADARVPAEQTSARAKPRPIVEIAGDLSPTQRRVERTPGQNSTLGSATEAESGTSQDESHAPANDVSQRPNGTADSGGIGQGETRTPLANSRNFTEALPRNTSRTTNAGPSATGGIGRTANAAEPGTAAGGTVASDNHSALPPWQRGDWPSSVESAQRDVSSGRVPEAARDLVRGYFDLP
jgi:hypothetical protein